MQNLFWIAGYPKSGNTWVRLFIAAITRERPNAFAAMEETALQCSARLMVAAVRGGAFAYSHKLDVLADRAFIQRNFNERLDRRAGGGRHLLVKSHSYAGSVNGQLQIAEGVAAKAIIVIRNPFDVCLSFSRHHGLDVGDAVEAMCNAAAMLPEHEVAHPMFLSSWGENVRSWLRREDFASLTIRYEDMVAKPITTFRRIAAFASQVRGERQILHALKQTQFDLLRSQEEQSGFAERSRKAERFFAQGTVGAGFAALSPAQRERLFTHDEDLCRALGYFYSGDELSIGEIDLEALDRVLRGGQGEVEADGQPAGGEGSIR
jgi:hypothetical protein